MYIKTLLMKYIISVTFFICISIFNANVLAQADISIATHWYNRANYNPASIARTDYLYLFSNVRQQWTGVTGSPQVVNVQASLYDSNMNSAFGISLVSDQIGLSQAINPMLTYAYRLSDDDKWSFSMGLSVGIFSRFVNTSLFQPVEDGDPALNYNTEPLLKPDANIGFEFQSNHLIAGLSMTHMLAIGSTDSSYSNSNHRYAYFILKSTDMELLNLYAGLQFVNRSNLNVLEANASVRFKDPTGLTEGSRELFDLGVSYRTTKQMTFLLGWNLSQNFRIGYAYDQSFVTGYNQNGSHEIMLEYRIPLKSAECIPCRNTDSWYR